VPVADAPEFSFEAPGDIADLIYLDALQLSRLESPDEWGVALLRLQANLPDTLPGQNVTMLLFGDVAIENADEEPTPTLIGTIASNANLRGGPGTSFAVVGSGTVGMEVTIDGRNETGDWFRFVLPESEETAWIFSSLITIEGNVESLPVMTADDEAVSPNYGPMQAFYFSTGVGELQCVEAPPNGILVQTPQGQGEVLIRANEVDITLGSTAFLRAIPSDFMTVDLLENQARVKALDTTVFVPAGARARIPLDAEGLPSGPPELVVYELDDIANLPVDNLERAIDIPEPLTQDELIASIVSGEWRQVTTPDFVVCNNQRVTPRGEGQSTPWRFIARPGENGVEIFYNVEDEIAEGQLGEHWTQIAPLTYVRDSFGTDNVTFTYTLIWTSPATALISELVEVHAPDANCTVTRTYDLERVG
jgi:hypothetical protein